MRGDPLERPFTDRQGTVWKRVRCAGCGVGAGHTGEGSMSRAFYCSTWCIWEQELRKPLSQRTSRLSHMEALKDLWYWLFQVGYRPAHIAALFDIENDYRIHKAIQSRRRDDEGKLRDAPPKALAVVKRRRSATG